MSTLDQFRHSLGRTWENIAEGWQKLRERAEHAMTRYRPLSGRRDLETWEDRIVQQSADWGLVAAEVREDEDLVTVRLGIIYHRESLVVMGKRFLMSIQLLCLIAGYNKIMIGFLELGGLLKMKGQAGRHFR